MHKWRFFFHLASFFFVPSPVNGCNSAITFERNGGRFGDDLVSCSQAFWIHYYYNIPLLLKPFHYSDHLQIHRQHKLYTNDLLKHFKQTVYIKASSPIETIADSTLYITTFRESPGVDWSDREFVKMLRNAISPIDPDWDYIKLPDNHHTIALHIRRGGGFSYDKGFRATIPLQFPSLDYYAQSLSILLQHLEGPCYIHLFTDDPKPKSLAKKIKKELRKPDQIRSVITYRKSNNSHDKNVLSDFFDMMQFKYLIRSCSHFSLFAEQLGTCSLSITPASALHKKGTWGKITGIDVTTFTAMRADTTRIPLDKNKPRISLLESPEMRAILGDPQYRAEERVLRPTLLLGY